jgi:hypothetical protein
MARTPTRRIVSFSWIDESDPPNEKSDRVTYRKCSSELQGGDVTYQRILLLRRVYDTETHAELPIAMKSFSAILIVRQHIHHSELGCTRVRVRLGVKFGISLGQTGPGASSGIGLSRSSCATTGHR